MALELPVLDLAGSDLQTLGQQFRQAGEKTGFLQIVNHGIPAETISRTFQMAEKFFSLPLEDVSPMDLGEASFVSVAS